MKISTKGRYGLRAFIDLAMHEEGTPVSINSISLRQNISERYLEQLMAKLKKAGLVKSVRGATGGYVLTKSPSEVSVGDVLRALEGGLEPVACVSCSSEETCENEYTCAAKYVWQKINESITNTVDGITIQTLVEKSIDLVRKESKDE